MKHKVLNLTIGMLITLVITAGCDINPGSSERISANVSEQQPASITGEATAAPLPAGEGFVFAIEADPHLDQNADPSLFSQTLSNINSAKPSFLIDLGDTFMTEKLASNEQEAEQRYSMFKSYFDSLDGIPLYLVNGNHDGESGWETKKQTWARVMRLKYFPADTSAKDFSGNTDTANYYSFVYGDALFVMLDPFTFSTQKAKSDSDGWNYTLGKEQYDWFKSVLQGSTSKYKFVFIHNLVGGIGKDARGGAEAAEYFEWGGYSSDGSYGFDKMRPGWGVPIAKLLSDNHVTAVFHGHDHFYAKQSLNGIVYQLVPQPGTPGNSYKDAGRFGYEDGIFLPSAGYLKVTVSGETITVEYVKSSSEQGKNAEIADSYTIPQSN